LILAASIALLDADHLAPVKLDRLIAVSAQYLDKPPRRADRLAPTDALDLFFASDLHYLIIEDVLMIKD
jgi:hypothetical protein